jgi:hypothetical protein
LDTVVAWGSLWASGGSRDYRANRVDGANRWNADASRRGAGLYQARNAAWRLAVRRKPRRGL